MPGQFDLGVGAGQAASGDRSMDAILTTRGDTPVRDSTGTTVRQAVGAAGLFRGSDGTDLINRYPPGYQLLFDQGTFLTGNGASTPETDILSAGSTSGLACFLAGVAIGDTFSFLMRGTFFNNSGTSTYTSRIRLYYGSGTFIDETSAALTSNAAGRVWSLNGEFTLTGIAGAGAGACRIASTRIGFNVVDAPIAGGLSTLAANTIEISDATTATPTAATNAAQNLRVTALHSNNTASMTTTLTYCMVRYYPRNY